MPRRNRPSRAGPRSKPRPVDRKDGKLKRWNKPADIELDEEDQFHASRDKILIDGADDVDGDSDEEEEVFALRGVSSDSDDDADEAVDRHDSDTTPADSDSEPVVPSKSKKAAKSARDVKKPTKASDSEEGEETWGRSKGAYYSSNAARIDSDDEEANELEEQEALRLQAKAREAMCDEDFGLGDVGEGDVEPLEATEQKTPSIPPPENVPRDKQSILRSLEREFPETLALARDWDDTVHKLVEAKSRVEALNESESDSLEFGLQHMYYQALLTYTTTLAFYLHLRATEKYAARPQLLRQHPILNRLLTLKEGINTLESLGVGQDTSDNDNNGEDSEEEEGETDEGSEDGNLWSLIQKNGLESDELADLLEDAAQNPSPPPPITITIPRPRKPAHAEKERLKKKHNPAVIHGSDDGTRDLGFDLTEPEYGRTSRKTKRVPVVDTLTDPYGEVTALDHHDLSDKQARKKSLRFHVSRIESSSSRRANARANAIGGDDDIPYRERRKEREARLEKERERKHVDGRLGAGGDDLDDVDPEISKAEKKRKRKRSVDEEEEAEAEEDAIGYYDLVKQASAEKKARKKADYDALTARSELESESTSGPRSVTRAILKNKGLTPHRSKAVRNPRVKKRQKYDQAKKRVASQKSVYKGGIGDVSKYSGEQSGISKVVKSVRL